MPAKFALPIMHITAGNYLPFAGKFLQGRTFYQPIESLAVKDLYPTGGPPDVVAHLNDPISKFYAPGIEMFFDGVDTEVSKIYSMLDGFITWKDNRLIMTPEPRALNELAQHKMLEAPLCRVIYESLEKASVKTALMDLIVNSFQLASNHPILKGGVLGGLGPVTFKTIKALLQAQLPITLSLAAAVEPVVDTFLSGGHTFQVLAGDLLGKADFFKANDKLPDLNSRPAWFKNITDADRARKILVITKDVGKQILNPWYYLYQYNSSPQVTPITILRNAHPLLVNSTQPDYGRYIMGTQYYIPPGDLNTFHGVPNSDPDSLKTFPSLSNYEWRYNDDCLFEANTDELESDFFVPFGISGTPIPFDIPSDIYHQNKMASIKTLYLALLNDYCVKMQLPVELMFGLIGGESDGTTPGDVRLEPLRDQDETALKSTDLFHKYNKLTGLHCKAIHVTKEEDNIKFLVESNEQIKQISIDTELKVDVPMRLYYDKDKYWLMRKQGSGVPNTIDIKVKELYETGISGKQSFGKKLFYPINKITTGKASLADVEITTMIKTSYFQLAMKNDDEVFDKKPTLNGGTTITIWINGVESDLSFTLAKGGKKINNDRIRGKTISISPTDNIGMSVETHGTAGEIENLKLKFKLVTIWVKIPEAQNDKNASYGDIKRYSAGMVPGGFMDPASTRYFPIGVMAAGVEDKKTVATLKVPSDGFLLISKLFVNANTLSKQSHVSILRKKGDEYEVTAIIANIPSGVTKELKTPNSEMVKKDEEFIMEITTPAASPDVPIPLAENLGGVTMYVYFVPFNNDESFLTSRNGYSFDILKFNRTVKSVPIHTQNGRTMTWDELDVWIRKTDGWRISVGPLQLLIHTAKLTVGTATSLINLMIPPLNLTDVALYLDHSTDPVKALAIGAALIRQQYNFPPDSKGQNQSTQFDLPVVLSVHNAQRRTDKGIKISGGNWGLLFADPDVYIRNGSSMLNLARKKYNKVDFIPTVQFKK